MKDQPSIIWEREGVRRKGFGRAGAPSTKKKAPSQPSLPAPSTDKPPTPFDRHVGRFLLGQPPLSIRLQGTRRLLDKRTAHSSPPTQTLVVHIHRHSLSSPRAAQLRGSECGPKWGMRQQSTGQDRAREVRRITNRRQGSESRSALKMKKCR